MFANTNLVISQTIQVFPYSDLFWKHVSLSVQCHQVEWPYEQFKEQIM